MDTRTLVLFGMMVEDFELEPVELSEMQEIWSNFSGESTPTLRQLNDNNKLSIFCTTTSIKGMRRFAH